MRTGIQTWGSVVAGVVLCIGLIGGATAQSKILSEQIAFNAATARDSGALTRGELRIPDGDPSPLPAVLVLHSANGINTTGGFYIGALNQAGIATLEITMFPNRSAMPRTNRDVMPQAFGSLMYLAEHPRIDPARIGVLGFSYGGIMTLLMSSRDVTAEYTGGKARFAAHLALYPVCWVHRQIVAGGYRTYGANTYQHVTGAPVHILTGEFDDYDEPDTCPKLVAALPEDVRKHFAVTVYPRAHHGFDEPDADRQYQDQFAFLGRGGRVTHRANPQIAFKSQAFAVEFFTKYLGPQKH